MERGTSVQDGQTDGGLRLQVRRGLNELQSPSEIDHQSPVRTKWGSVRPTPPTRTPTATDDPGTAETTNTESIESPSTLEYIPLNQWATDSSDFNGIANWRDRSEMTVLVGAEGNHRSFAFEPPALFLRSNTTIVRKWTGEGGVHNVSFRTLEIDSGAPTDAVGTTFEHEFERTGRHLYACDAHHSLGMKGGFEVIQ